MAELHGPWLEIAIFLPLVMAAVVSRIRNPVLSWRVTSTVAGVVLGITIVDWFDFMSLHTFEAHDPLSIAQSLFGTEIIYVDQFNAPLLVLAALLYFFVILLTPSSKRDRFPFGLTLVSMTLLLTLLSSRAPLLLIGLLAAQNLLPLIEFKRRQQPWKFFAAYQALSLVLISVGWCCMDPKELSSTQSVTGSILMAAGLLIRCGCLPFQSWMVDLFDRLSLGTAILFVTPMAGAYCLVRMLLPIVTSEVLQGITVVSLATALYASGMVLVQDGTRRWFCYLFVANSSLLLVGLESLSPVGLASSLSLWLSINIALMSLGITIRALEGRVGRVSINRYHGLFRQMPLLAAFFLLATLASIGFPGTVGFVGIELLVECAIHANPLYGVVVVAATALNGIAALRVYFRLFTGTPAPATISMQPRPLERLAIWAIAALVIVGGIVPQPGVTTRYRAATELLRQRSEELGDKHKEGQSRVGCVQRSELPRKVAIGKPIFQWYTCKRVRHAPWEVAD